MIEKINKWLTVVNTIAIVVIALVLVGGNNQSANLGASGTRFPNGISTDSTSPSAGGIRGTTLTITGNTTLGSTGNTLTLPGGVDLYATSSSFSTTASLTPCSIQVTATSSLVAYIVNITTATSTGGTLIYDVGIDDTRTATTTIINGGNTVAQGALASYSATTSPRVGAGQWLVVKFNPAFASSAFGPILGGTCSAILASP